MNHISMPIESSIELINMEPIEHSPLISKCQIKVCYVQDEPNRNNSIITKDVALKMAPSLRGAAIVGHYNKEQEDFEQHNRVINIGKTLELKEDTFPYGFVDLNAKVWFQKFIDDDSIEREYLVTEGYLWTGQYPECQRVIDKGNAQSMELDDKLTNGTWTNFDNNNMDFFIINDAVISKLCILGEDVEPCFEGASITNTNFSFNIDNFKQTLFTLVKDMKSILNKGGENMDENKVIDSTLENTESSVTEYSEGKKVESNQSKNEETIVEELKTENIVTYNLNDIPEYNELLNNFNNQTKEYNELKNDYNNIIKELNDLKEFKVKAERTNKQALIDQFYMLSDEDKKDVKEHIDEYSLDDIEAKLSVICVRNKVSFSKEEENQKGAITYQIDETVDNTPDWIKAVLETSKELN